MGHRYLFERYLGVYILFIFHVEKRVDEVVFQRLVEFVL